MSDNLEMQPRLEVIDNNLWLSSLLRRIQDMLSRASDSSFMVVSLEPWEYENAGQFRSTLVEIVPTELQDLVRENEDLGRKVGRLLGRAGFGR